MAETDRFRNRYQEMCAAPWRMMELVTAFCLSPITDPNEEVDPQAEELLLDASRLRRDLDILFSTEMRREIVIFVKQLDANREQYRKSFLLWIDIVEEFAFEVEKALGDGTGPVKLKRVRGGMFYFLDQFTEGAEVPGIPAYFNRLGLDIVIQATVEFIITLVNTDKMPVRAPVQAAIYDRGLWKKALAKEKGAEAQAPPTPGLWRRIRQRLTGWRNWRIVVLISKWFTPLINAVVNWILGGLLTPPAVPADLKLKIDIIIKDFRQNAPPDQPPVEGLVHWFLDVATWMGTHGKEVRAAIDVLSITVAWTAELSDLTRERRIELIENALILYFDELGLRGPYFRFILRFLVDIGLDAILFLYQKRDVEIAGRPVASP